MIYTLIPVYAVQLSSTLSYSTYLYTLGNKRKRKEADYIFYISVVVFLSYTTQALVPKWFQLFIDKGTESEYH